MLFSSLCWWRGALWFMFRMSGMHLYSHFLDNRFFGTIQVGVATPVNGDVIFDYEGLNISTGLGFRLGGLHWDIKDKQQ